MEGSASTIERKKQSHQRAKITGGRAIVTEVFSILEVGSRTEGGEGGVTFRPRGEKERSPVVSGAGAQILGKKDRKKRRQF